MEYSGGQRWVKTGANLQGNEEKRLSVGDKHGQTKVALARFKSGRLFRHSALSIRSPVCIRLHVRAVGKVTLQREYYDVDIFTIPVHELS